MAKRKFQTAKVILLCGLILSCLSGFIPSEVYISHYFWNTEGHDCRLNPCLNAASGWPIPFIWDKSWLSPVGSADWIGLLLGVDSFDILSFIKNTLIWLILIFGLSKFLQWKKISNV